jgi:hypothetical protein
MPLAAAHSQDPQPARPPEPAGDDGPTTASAVQLAVGLLTASLDSRNWKSGPRGPWYRRIGALAGVIAGLHLVNLLLLHQLYEATGQLSVTTLQKLAIVAAAGPPPPFIG